MSCMEHTCTQCDWFSLDNKSPIEWITCPKCGGHVTHHSDEQDDAAREVAEDECERRLDPWETEP